MSEVSVSGIDKSVWLISRDTGGWTDGTRVHVSWRFELLDSAGGAYRASQVKVAVHLSEAPPLASVELHLLERNPQSGMVASDIRRRLDWMGGHYETIFDWYSGPQIPEQELHIALKPVALHESQMRLKDPISRRFNFLLSFAA